MKKGGKNRNKKGQFAKKQYIPLNAYMASITFWLAVLSIPIIVITQNVSHETIPTWEEVFTEAQIQEAHAMWLAEQIPSVKDPTSLDTVSLTTDIPKEIENASQEQIEGNNDYPVNEITELIRKYAKEYGIDENEALRIAYCESSFNPEAENWQGSTAKGLYQFTDPTWQWIGAEGHQFNAEENVKMFMTWFPVFPTWWACY